MREQQTNVPCCMYCKELCQLKIVNMCGYCIHEESEYERNVKKYICSTCSHEKWKRYKCCLECRSLINTDTRILRTKDMIHIEHPDSIKENRCNKCKTKLHVGFYGINHFCTICFANRKNAYLCNFCYESYSQMYKSCLVCCNRIIYNHL